MLYGMDDDDYNEEFGLEKINKLNSKKISLIVAIALVGIVVIYISFRISYGILSKDSQNES